MELVKLKMRTVYKMFLSILAVLIILVASLGITYLFSDRIISSDLDIEVTKNLSINYLNGKKISVDKKAEIKFSITNTSDKVIYYNIGFLKIRGNGKYNLKSENIIITEGLLKSTDELTTDYISIDVGETKIYTLEVTNNDENKLTCLLNIRDKEGKNETFSDIIIKNSNPVISSLTKVGSEIATENEGLIKSYDDIGVSYYFRGNIPNNYVTFADMTWRIVRINGDGTVRMILDGVTDSLSSYYTVDNYIRDFEKSQINEHLLNWYELKLKNYSDYIANTKFCSDIEYDEEYNYPSYSRIMTNKIPTLNCLGESINNNIGMLTIDEVILAGAAPLEGNQNYYLYNPNIDNSWYTMSGAKGTENTMNLFMIDSTGNINTDLSGDLYRYVRPVINLVKNIEMIGEGTLDNPYRLGGENE